MFRTITAKFPGTCKRCQEPITPGQRIRFGGRGRTYHLAAECPKGTAYTDDPPYAHLGNYQDATEPEPEPVTPSPVSVAELRF
jgi:hypothetical protein